MGENSYFNAYQNAGVMASQAVNAFDLIVISPKLQNQFLGKDIPLSETSKSELFNGLISRETGAIERPIGETLVNVGAFELGGVFLGKLLGLGSNFFVNLLKKSSEKVVKQASTSTLTNSEYLRIENAATRINMPINVVGSRASGTATAYSDWDYIIGGINKRNWSKIKKSLPGARSVLDNTPRNIDLIKESLDRTRPFITIYPRR